MSGRAGAIVRSLIHEGTIRALAVVADGPVEEVRRRHGLQGRAAQLSAEGMVAGALLSAHVKGEERLLLQVQGETPRFSFTAELDAEGGLRGWIRPEALPDFGAVDGYLMAIKYEGAKELYRGVAPIRGGGFEAALNHYLLQSQQTQGLVRLQARVAASGEVTLATGLLVERLGNSLSDEDFYDLVEPLRAAPLSEVMAHFAFGSLLGSPVEVLESRRLEFRCRCSVQKVERTLSTLGAEDLRALEQEQGHAEVTCHFCSERYVVPGARLISLADALDAARG
ncbi:MAG: Hsp33 family molecular chaperone HslO [Alphaproteobacteria bacterium]|nr:Hsp33 family molecular chaperone HslO [Alphaproteobacteria bacterium]